MYIIKLLIIFFKKKVYILNIILLFVFTLLNYN